jgi:hypothetical protein
MYSALYCTYSMCQIMYRSSSLLNSKVKMFIHSVQFVKTPNKTDTIKHSANIFMLFFGEYGRER